MTNKTLREKYIANEILNIGDVVEDSKTKETLKIIDRGSNYITVISESAGIQKKWITEVTETPTEEKTPDFIITESGQVKLFGYETKSFDRFLSEEIIEQFNEFDDTYSKHQIIKLLDSSLNESNLDRKYDLIEKVSAFYTNHNIEEPLILEAIKSEIERKRISMIIAVVAGVDVGKMTPYQTVVASVKALKDKYKERKQWEVLWPFFKLINNSGITGIVNQLPFQFDKDGFKQTPDKYDSSLEESVIQLLEDNLDELADSFEIEDLLETFSEDEFTENILTEEQIDEVLSMTARMNLGRKMKTRETMLATKRVRAMTRGATSATLMSRARRMAETMIKRRMFRKDPSLMTRQEKERFEGGASRRKALVARLAQRLLGRVRTIQSDRMHAMNASNAANPGQTTHHGATVGGAD